MSVYIWTNDGPIPLGEGILQENGMETWLENGNYVDFEVPRVKQVAYNNDSRTIPYRDVSYQSLLSYTADKKGKYIVSIAGHSEGREDFTHVYGVKNSTKIGEIKPSYNGAVFELSTFLVDADVGDVIEAGGNGGAGYSTRNLTYRWSAIDYIDGDLVEVSRESKAFVQGQTLEINTPEFNVVRVVNSNYGIDMYIPKERFLKCSRSDIGGWVDGVSIYNASDGRSNIIIPDTTGKITMEFLSRAPAGDFTFIFYK